MKSDKIIQGFSLLSREEKIRVASSFASHPAAFEKEMFDQWQQQKLLSNDNFGDFTENAVSRFYLPYSLAPNFKINGIDYMVPMVTEESSVVAAASAAAKFWWSHGGFHTRIKGVLKPGHIHFFWKGSRIAIESFVAEIIPGMMESIKTIVESMEARGGGISGIRLNDMTDKLHGYFQIEVMFNTVDAMGANFINTCLEAMVTYMDQQAELREISAQLEIIMAILSNYTAQCLVECEVTCAVKEAGEEIQESVKKDLFRRIEKAVLIARYDVSRAVTHNKGIFNGVDAVVLATGNDFRAVEAAGHAWASRDGTYRGLSRASIEHGRFIFTIEMPMPVGIVGGMTTLHPLARASLQLLGNPSSETLMSVIAATGMANHFSAIKALVSGGIQRGHMKLHLANILKQQNADLKETEEALRYFEHHSISVSEVRNFLSRLRGIQP